MTNEQKAALDYWEWDVECESPLEIRHRDGGAFASGIAADYVIDALVEEWHTETGNLERRERAELLRLHVKYVGKKNHGTPETPR